MNTQIGQLNKGKHLSEEVKKNISNAIKAGFQKGRIAWNTGLKHTEETKQKMSVALKGRKIWNKGIARTEAEKLHISESLKGKVAWNKGKKWNQLVLDKISKSQKERLAKLKSL